MPYPREYKGLILQALAEYRLVRTREHQSAGKSGTIGWGRISAEILGSQQHHASDDEIKSLKNAIEIHFSTKRPAFISDDNFAKVHRFVIELDARGSMDGPLREARRARLKHQREIVNEVLGKPLPAEASFTIKLADGAVFVVTDGKEDEAFYSVVIQLFASASGAVGIDAYFFVGPFEDYVATRRTAGAVLINGFAALNGFARDDDFFPLLPTRHTPSYPNPMVAAGTAILDGSEVMTRSPVTQMGFNFRIGGQTDKAGKKVYLKLTPITAPMNVLHGKPVGSGFERGSSGEAGSMMKEMYSISAQQITDRKSYDYISSLKRKLDLEN